MSLLSVLLIAAGLLIWGCGSLALFRYGPAQPSLPEILLMVLWPLALAALMIVGGLELAFVMVVAGLRATMRLLR